jgi:hypothetical protein
MPITADNAIHIQLNTIDFEFVMFAEATFYTDDVDITNITYETLDGDDFELLDDGDVDQATELWIEATVNAMAERVHDDWLIDCEAAGGEVDYPDSPFYP